MQVAVFHPGTQHSWQTALALQDINRLEFYATSIFHRSGHFPFFLENLIPGTFGNRVRSEFSRFAFPALDPENVRTAGQTFEWLERIAARLGYRTFAHWLNLRGNERFAGALRQEIRSGTKFALWGYNSSALEAFQMGQEYGRTNILDRTIGDWRYYNRAVDQMQKTHAEWFTGGRGKQDIARIEREDREHELADVILCGSEFAAQTVRDFSASDAVAKKVRVLPYCYDRALFAEPPEFVSAAKDRPVRFLFNGVAAPRKGIQHVLEAIARLPRSGAELTILGRIDVPADIFARYADRVTFLPTVPRSQVPAIMAQHHCLLLPSYFEGSALSLIEGLASGLALIQTPQAGSGVTKETGILLERPDTELLFQAMSRLIDDRNLLDSFRAAAPREARNYTSDKYRENIGRVLSGL